MDMSYNDWELIENELYRRDKSIEALQTAIVELSKEIKELKKRCKE